MNPILSLLSGGESGGKSFVSIILKAVNAAASGKAPTDFLKELAKTTPELQGLDLDDLEATANLLAKKKGKNLDELKAKVPEIIQKYT